MIGIDLCTALVSEYSDDGYLGVQVDGYGGTDAGLVPFEQAVPFGLISRPIDANSDGLGSLSIRLWDGTAGGYVLQLHDARYVDIVPQVSKGSSGLANAKGAFFSLDHDDETATLYVPIDGGSGAHLIQVGLDGSGQPAISIVHSAGMALTMLGESLIIANASGSVWIEVNGSQVVVSGNTKLVGGLDVGGEGGVPLATIPGVGVLLGSIATTLATQTSAVTGAQVASAITAALTNIAAAGSTMLRSL